MYTYIYIYICIYTYICRYNSIYVYIYICTIYNMYRKTLDHIENFGIDGGEPTHKEIEQLQFILISLMCSRI